MKDSIKNPAPIAPTSAGVGSAAKVTDASSAPSKNTKLAKKKGAQSGNPASQPVAHRSEVKARSGASYGIRAKMGGGSDPAAGATLANGKLFAPAVNRTRPNFQSGYSDLD